MCRSGICVIESGTCGDGTCDANEDCSCPDCEGQRDGCGVGYVCSSGSCTPVNECTEAAPIQCEHPGTAPVAITGQTVISTPGNYVLNSNFLNQNPTSGCNGDGGNCVFILFSSGASDSTLDCQGHTIDGTDDSGWPYRGGIKIRDATCVLIKNCVLTGWYDAVTIGPGADGTTFEDNNANSNTNCGFRNWSAEDGADGVVFTNNAANGNKLGFCAYYGSCATFQGNTACGNWVDNPDSGFYCNSNMHIDAGGNTCEPSPGTQCSGSVVCNPGCPAG